MSVNSTIRRTSNTKNNLEKGFDKIVSPFQQFIKDQTTSSIFLIVCTIAALIIANSPIGHRYEELLDAPLGLFFADYSITMDVRHWINEGLMAFFFFLLGMEIKREILVGEIKDLQRFMPIGVAALAGMMIPALIFYSLNAGTEYSKGWGIPMATDTAFAVGVLAILGNRIPKSAFVFLTALAIIDDLGAIIIIATFYSDNINMINIALSIFVLALLALINLVGIRRPVIYLFLGVLAWLAMLGSGIHATIAGILVAITVPARSAMEPGWFLQRTKNLIHKFETMEKNKQIETPMLAEAEQHNVVEGVQDAAEKATTPLRRWENALEHPIALFVLPIFALANAGIVLNLDQFQAVWTNTLAIGIMLGLVLGKGIGIPLFTWLVIRMKLGRLPHGLTIQHIVGIGLLCGMGFTMSIFISSLGFEDTPASLVVAKTGILMASLLAGILGYLWLRIPFGDKKNIQT